ncbi:hypothetical protein Nepgr_015553 [Nepenthes gracilis]|uniref:Caffeoyl-CoA O-methyltransferase n=1 Tax=Nepenthes gracilis TaxID=150966 RepID=A0AAD3SNG8_NEPGR|nr:hypothetical protein Nepgr_015553 [Nepenthes gracilis]
MDFADAKVKGNPVILQSQELFDYLLETSVYPREPAALKELREATASHSHAFYAATPDVGQLMALMLKLINAKKTIEIGVFTGYSLLATALNIPEDGEIIAIDPDRKAYEVGVPIIEKAGVMKKIKFIESPALPVLDKLLEDKSNEGSFDFAFVDADKNNYYNYHQRVIKLVKVGGLLMYDNTLFGGAVIAPEAEVEDYKRPFRRGTIEFTKAVVADDRVELCHICSGDGVIICKRLY